MASHWSLVSMRLASASPASSCVLLNSLNALLRANAQGCEDPVGVVTTEGVATWTGCYAREGMSPDSRLDGCWLRGSLDERHQGLWQPGRDVIGRAEYQRLESQHHRVLLDRACSSCP